MVVEGIRRVMDSLNRIFDLLSKERRRYALYYLERQDGPVSVDELAERVVEWETDPAAVSIPEERFERVEIELHHNHLPKASEAEFVEYNPERREVEVTGTPPEFNAIISIAEIVERAPRNS
jgi:hypothetical protein